MIKFTLLSIFPNMFNEFINTSIIKRAIDEKKVKVDTVDIRDFTLDKHNRVDFPPYGGGAGMVMSPKPLGDAIDYVISKNEKKTPYSIIYLSPRGKVLNYDVSLELSKNSNMHYILICGHYEGIDERIIKKYNVLEISIGDYVLTGGELPAMVLMDSIIRLIPGVITGDSLKDESHTNFLLEYPQYTKPAIYDGFEVPEVLTSGNHQKVDEYRQIERIKITYKNRPELLKKAVDNKLLSKEKIEKILNIEGGENNGHN